VTCRALLADPRAQLPDALPMAGGEHA